MKQNAFQNDIEESKKDVDEDGNPLTIQAAQRLFHRNNNKIYFSSYDFRSIDDVNK